GVTRGYDGDHVHRTSGYPIDISKMYSESGAPPPSRTPTESPDANKSSAGGGSDRPEVGTSSSSGSSTSTSSAAASPGGLSAYYPGAGAMQQGAPMPGLIPM
ncbi:unnamed protein product, partial [Timema podura]|nr:unnamed protein product [Timema podura]